MEGQADVSDGLIVEATVLGLAVEGPQVVDEGDWWLTVVVQILMDKDQNSRRLLDKVAPPLAWGSKFEFTNMTSVRGTSSCSSAHAIGIEPVESD